MISTNILKRSHPTSVFKIIAPQDGGWSLSKMEQLLGGLRSHDDTLSLELFASNGVISYGVRTHNGETVGGMFNSYFPQARISRHEQGGSEELDRNDWLHIGKGELALVQSVSLAKESYLPLKVLDDRAIEQSQTDPLAGIIGCLASCTESGSDGGGDSADRLGLRLIIRPAAEDWNAPWQKKMQKRRDGEDRNPKAGGGRVDTGPSTGTLAAALGAAGFLAGNYLLLDSHNYYGLVLFNVGSLAALAGGVFLMKKFGGNANRSYMDEELVEAKLKSLAFWSELQVVRIYNRDVDVGKARLSLEQVMDCLRGFDDPAGNSWAGGKIREFSGDDVISGTSRRHPFVSRGVVEEEAEDESKEKDLVIGNEVLSWIEPKQARRTALSSREVASLWHLPLGSEEMASMERTASGVRIPYLADLSVVGGDSGPLVGMAGHNQKIHLPESSIEKHAIILGRSGVGKSTMIKHVLAHKFERKADGKDNGAVVVIDPHADLVRDALKMVPVSIAHKVRLLDFGRMDRVPGINLVDPELFPDRDRCVDTIIETVKHLWEHWGGRLEDLLKRSLLIVYEFNSHPETKRSEMLTMLDILTLLDDGETVGRGRDARTEMSGFQSFVLSRVKDVSLKQWFNAYLGWDRSLRSEATGPVHSRIGAYASDQRAKVIMGQRESTIMLSDVLSEGLILLVSTAKGSIGEGPAALMGGTMVSLVESALRQQEELAYKDRSKCLLICDEFQTVTGANWEGLLAEIRKYGCSLMLATQSLARLDTPERKLKAGILGNVGCIIGYQMAAEDARIISPELDSDRVPESFLVNQHPHYCYVRINSSSKCYPSFSMVTNAPPDETKGSEESVRAVLDASQVYTVDAEEVRERINSEAQARMDRQKLGSEGGEISAVEAAANRLNLSPIPSELGGPSGGEKPSPPLETPPVEADVSSKEESSSLVSKVESPVPSDASVSQGGGEKADVSEPSYNADFSKPMVDGEVRKAGADVVSGAGAPEKAAVSSIPGKSARSETRESGELVSGRSSAPSYGADDSEPVGSLRDGKVVEIVKSGHPSPGPHVNGKSVEEAQVPVDSASEAPALDDSFPTETPDGRMVLHDADGEPMPLSHPNEYGDSDPVDFLDPRDVANSRYTRDFLGKVISDTNLDKGLRASLDKRLGNHISRERRRVLRDESVRIRKAVISELSDSLAESRAQVQREFEKVQEERSRLQESIALAAEKIRDEERAKARAELGAQMSRGQGARNFDNLRRVD